MHYQRYYKSLKDQLRIYLDHSLFRLHTIVTGITADDTVNVDPAKEVGEKILNGMVGKGVGRIHIQEKDQAVTLRDSSAVKMKE